MVHRVLVPKDGAGPGHDPIPVSARFSVEVDGGDEHAGGEGPEVEVVDPTNPFDPHQPPFDLPEVDSGRGFLQQDNNPLLLTTEGEFVAKNLVLISAGLTVGSQIRTLPGWRSTVPAEPRPAGISRLTSFPRTASTGPQPPRLHPRRRAAIDLQVSELSAGVLRIAITRPRRIVTGLLQPPHGLTGQ